jgi:hypothetical protein
MDGKIIPYNARILVADAKKAAPPAQRRQHH